MILGSYPCCGGDLQIAMPDETPAFAKETCPHCGTTVWHKLSRWQSTSFTEEGFEEEYEVSYADDGKIASIINRAERAAKEEYEAKTPEQKKLHGVITGILKRTMPQIMANEIIGRN